MNSKNIFPFQLLLLRQWLWLLRQLQPQFLDQNTWEIPASDNIQRNFLTAMKKFPYFKVLEIVLGTFLSLDQTSGWALDEENSVLRIPLKPCFSDFNVHTNNMEVFYKNTTADASVVVKVTLVTSRPQLKSLYSKYVVEMEQHLQIEWMSAAFQTGS